MFDAGTISLPAIALVEQLAGVQRADDDAPLACAMIGAAKTASRSRRSRSTGLDRVLPDRGFGARSLRRRTGDGWTACRGTGARGGRAVPATSATRQRRRSYFSSWSALTTASIAPASIFAAPGSPARDANAVGAGLGQRDSSSFLPSSNLIVAGSSGCGQRLGGRRGVDEAGGADAGERGQQRVERRLIELARLRRQLPPLLLVLAFLVLGLRLLERVGLAGADDLEPRRVEAAGVEQILLPVLGRILLQLVEDVRFDGEDRRPRQIPARRRCLRRPGRRSTSVACDEPGAELARSPPACRARTSSVRVGRVDDRSSSAARRAG